MFNIKIKFSLLVLLLNFEFSYTYDINQEKFQINAYDLYSNRIAFILNSSNYKIHEIFIENNFNSGNNNSQHKQLISDSNRIKWQYLGPAIALIAATNASIYYLFKDAYWNEEKTKFHTFNDWNNADMNIDKVGHFYAGVLLTKASYSLLRETNVPVKHSIIFSTLSSIFFQTQIELHDAYYKKWGWSWWDFSFNVLGAVYPHLQNLIKPLNSFNVKWSYNPSPAYKKGWYDHWIKDYEGFTYYLTIDINSLLPSKIENYWPDWLNIAIAYGVDKVKLGKNIWNSSNGPLGDREWYISLDYSLLKLFNPQSQFFRDILNFLDNFHFPAPAIKISPNVIWYGLYF